MALVWPPHTSMMRTCGRPDARRRISAAACSISSGCRNSSTYFMPRAASVAIEAVSFQLAHRLFVFAQHREQAQLLHRFRVADLRHREPDVDQYPVADANALDLQQVDVHLAPYFGDF